MLTASLTVSTAAAPTFSGTIGIVGRASRDTNLLGIGMYIGSTGVSLRCTTTANTVPGSTAGQPC